MAGKTTWCWRRLIAPDARELWLTRLEGAGVASWVFTERPGRARVVLEAYSGTKSDCALLVRRWGGRVRAIELAQWLAARPSPPTRVGRGLEIAHDEKAGEYDADSRPPSLRIPHGLAFGSGEHATTFMLLRALAEIGDFSDRSVLDLGTGSGVLALTARLFGAKQIVATDFDPEAVRTARQNEVLNFSRPLVRWRRADVRKLSRAIRYDLVLANLFSGILIEAAPQISRCVAPDGELWLSGILASQEREVAAAYHREKMKRIEMKRRGKWVMLKFSQPGRTFLRKSFSARHRLG